MLHLIDRLLRASRERRLTQARWDLEDARLAHVSAVCTKGVSRLEREHYRLQRRRAADRVAKLERKLGIASRDGT